MTGLPRSDTDALSREEAFWLHGFLESAFGGGFYLGFEEYMTEPEWAGHEWRFQGVLGFGGKVHRTSLGRVYVTAYPENLTPELSARIDRANERIANALERTRQP